MTSPGADIPIAPSQGNIAVTPEAQAPPSSVEYRDENGNLVAPEVVSSMAAEGAEIKTEHEVRTKTVDAAGNEVVEPQAVHPPHPDVEGRNPNTAREEKGQAQAEREANDAVPHVEADFDPSKEARVEEIDRKAGQPQPGSERAEATKKGT